MAGKENLDAWWDEDMNKALAASKESYELQLREDAELEAAIQESIRVAEREALEKAFKDSVLEITEIIARVNLKGDELEKEEINERAAKAADTAVTTALKAGSDAKAAMQAVSRCWRPQESNYCGWHAVDVVLCVLGLKSHISRETFEAQMLPEHDIGTDPKKQLYDGVGYSGAALINVLKKNGLKKVELTMKQPGRLDEFDSRLEALREDEPRAIIVGTTGHWVALVKQGDSWFNADSLNDMRASKACGMLSPVRYFANGMAGVIEYIKLKTPESGGILEIW